MASKTGNSEEHSTGGPILQWDDGKSNFAEFSRKFQCYLFTKYEQYAQILSSEEELDFPGPGPRPAGCVAENGGDQVYRQWEYDTEIAMKHRTAYPIARIRIYNHILLNLSAAGDTRVRRHPNSLLLIALNPLSFGRLCEKFTRAWAAEQV